MKMIVEICEAFTVPPELQGITVLDPERLPNDSAELPSYGMESIAMIAKFYGSSVQKGRKIFAPQVESNSVKSDFNVLKRFSYENRLRFETKQQLLLKQKEEELKVYQACLADGSA